MRLQDARQWKRALVTGLIVGALAIGCSNPLSNDDEPDDEVAEDVPTATAAQPMPIITATPIDPTAVAANPSPVTEARPDTYIVAENDTLYGIAARFDVDLSALVEANNLSDPNDIWIGQELIIPAPE